MSIRWHRIGHALLIGTAITVLGCDEVDIGPDDDLPVAVIEVESQLSFTVGETIVIDGSSSHDPGDGTEPSAGIESFLWSLSRIPDGGTNTLSPQREPMTELVPDAPGVWTVELTVTDGEGLQDFAERDINVEAN